MDPENQLPYLKLPAASPCRGSDKSSPHPPLPIRMSSILMLSSHLSPSLPSGICSLVVPTITLYVIFFAVRARGPAHLNLFD
jgi:hypothetical protein